MLAQADVARANMEVRAYKLRLEEAQREIDRAQEIVNMVQREKEEAEAEAARARTTARQFREERLISRALEKGKREGFQQGFARGRDMAWQEERTAQRAYDGRWSSRPIFNDEPLEEEDDEEEVREDAESDSPPVPIIQIREPTAGPMHSRAQVPEQSWRPPSR